jgi:hypothetical protein
LAEVNKREKYWQEKVMGMGIGERRDDEDEWKDEEWSGGGECCSPRLVVDGTSTNIISRRGRTFAQSQKAMGFVYPLHSNRSG